MERRVILMANKTSPSETLTRAKFVSDPATSERCLEETMLRLCRVEPPANLEALKTNGHFCDMARHEIDENAS
jgi:hypothetical protein